MRIEHAYSTDLDEIVDVETAYELFSAGRILDKHHFCCLYPGCDGDITAANLDKLRQDMSVDPHFRRVRDETHTPECNRDGGKVGEAPGTGDGARRERGRKDDAKPDQFMLARPESHKTKVQAPPPAADGKGPAGRKRRSGAPGDAAPRPYTSYSVGSLVSRYARYRKLGIDDQKSLSIKGFQLSYRDMFVRLAGLALDTVSPYPRVYFGRAFVNRKNTGYAIAFTDDDAVLVDGHPRRPSFFVSDDRIAKAFSRDLFERKFEDLSRRGRPDAWFFVYGIPERVEREEKTYVNFQVFNLDYIDFREGFEPDAGT